MNTIGTYDTYIFGKIAIEELPCIVWASYDLSNINGHSIEDISKDIQDMLVVDQNKLRPYLIKKAYYATTAVAVGIAICAIAEFGLTWAGLISIKFATTNNAYICFVITNFLALRLFSFIHQIDTIDTRTRVHIESIKKYGEEQIIFQGWYSEKSFRVQQLSTLHKRCQVLLNSSKDEQKIKKIGVSLEKIEKAQIEITTKLETINKLPPISRYIFLGYQNK